MLVWFTGVGLGLVAGGVVLAELPLWMKLVAGGLVIAVGVLGRLGSVLLAGLLLSAGLLTFVVLLLTGDLATLSPALGVATLLTSGGAALSIRWLFRERRSTQL